MNENPVSSLLGNIGTTNVNVTLDPATVAQAQQFLIYAGLTAMIVVFFTHSLYKGKFL